MKLTTAGESHGKGIYGIVEGVPANLKIDIAEINSYLSIRQGGFGRGARQKIECDKVEILSGVRNLVTLGSPIAFAVNNNDYENWKDCMAPEGCNPDVRPLTKVRPGHADLAGALKFGVSDARGVSERASARSTAALVVAGTLARQYLRAFGVKISGYVVSVGGITDDNFYSFEELERAKREPLFMLDSNKQLEAMDEVKAAGSCGDTVGGVIEIRANGLKSGFGSCMTYSEKLDARLCAALMSVQAIKGVEVGLGFKSAYMRGSGVHDEIFYNGKYYRKTNNAGGIEGGISNGEDIVLRAAMKPLPTLARGLGTVDIVTKEACAAAGERSDVCAICAAEIVAESVAAFVLADVVSARLGGDYMEEVTARYNALN